MKLCTQQEFELQLKELKADPASGLSGPFINSAPTGNAFSGPFKEYAWTIEKATVLMKKWSPAKGWNFYNSVIAGGVE